MTEKKNVFLDYIRGLACIAIILYHYTQRFEDLYHLTTKWGARLEYGWMGVAVFYILSGYLSVLKDESTLSAIDYIKKKIIRLYPAYWICAIITFLGTSFFLKDRAVSIGELIINLSMLESFVGAGLVDGAYWTLANELVFYAFILFVVVLLKKYNKLPIFFFGWMMLLFIFSCVEQEGLVYSALGKIIARPYGHMFIIGSSIHFYYNELRINRIFTAINSGLAILYQFIMFDIVYSIFFLAAIAVIYCSVIINKKQVKINQKLETLLKPLCLIASISYPMYLLHQNCGYIIMIALIKNGYDSEFIILIPMFILGIIAYCIHSYVEIPVLKKANKMTPERRNKQKVREI